MDFEALSVARYSLRKFSPAPVEEEKLSAILEAGRNAPTAHNLQPQRIFVARTEESLAKKKELWDYLKKKDLFLYLRIRRGLLGRMVNIPGKPGDDFVRLPYIEKNECLTLSQFTLKEVIRQTIFSIAPGDTNKLMTGELFEVFENELKVTSLDGHRISIRKVTLKDTYPKQKVVVPGKTLIEVSKILSGDTDKDVIIFFYGQAVSQEEVAQLQEFLAAEYPLVDTGFVDGKQGVYDFIISLE